MSGTEIVEMGRQFDASLRWSIKAGRTVEEVVELLGPPAVREQRNAERLLVYEHAVTQFDWAAVGGDPEWHRVRQAAIGVGRVLNAFRFGTVPYHQQQGRFDQAELGVAMEALQARILKAVAHESHVLVLRIEGSKSGDVVASWEYRGQDNDERLVETSEWFFGQGHEKRRELDRDAAPSANGESEEARAARTALEDELDAAGVFDPDVRARMILKALRGKGLVP